MNCSRCGTQLAAQMRFCPTCGAPAAVAAPPQIPIAQTTYVIGEDVVKRPLAISILAILQLLGGGVFVLLAIASLARAAIGSGRPQEDAVALVVAVFLGVIGGAQLACGLGLWKLRPYGRTLLLVFSVLWLFTLVGTVLGILLLIFLNKPGAKLLFSGRTPGEFSDDELGQIALTTRSGLATGIIVALLLPILGAPVLGIVAAIAVPGLLRARMAGNEASAIGSLRAISSGEASYAASCAAGGYAVTLDDLAKPPAGSTTGFVSPDLSTNGVERSGYRITVAREAGPFVQDVGTAAATCNGSTHAPAASFFATAEPVTLGTSGTRYFAIDARGAIYFSTSPIANPIAPSEKVVPLQ